jgi:hypothetical protein
VGADEFRPEQVLVDLFARRDTRGGAGPVEAAGGPQGADGDQDGGRGTAGDACSGVHGP